jgi:hypothetical protein
LLAAQLVSALRMNETTSNIGNINFNLFCFSLLEFHFSIAVRDIYTCPTIDGLAKIVETKEDERRQQKSSPSIGKKRVFNSNHMDFTSIMRQLHNVDVCVVLSFVYCL